MRYREIKKVKKEKFLNKKYSDYEIEEMINEINEHKTLLNSIGFNLNKHSKLQRKKINSSTSNLFKTKKKKSTKPKSKANKIKKDK
jgi:hypothetical protein